MRRSLYLFRKTNPIFYQDLPRDHVLNFVYSTEEGWLNGWSTETNLTSNSILKSAIKHKAPRHLTQQLLYSSHILTPSTYVPHTVTQTEYNFIVLFLLHRCLIFNRCCCLCAVERGETLFVLLCPSLIGPWPCRWVRDAKEEEEEWEDPKSLSSGFKAFLTHSLWTVVCMKCW